MATAITILERSSSSRIREAACLAISVPFLPIAMPICAALSAGPSFTPSPVIATISLFDFNALIIFNLASGNMRVKMVVFITQDFKSFSFNFINSSPEIVFSNPLNPICFAIAVVVNSLSPVIIFTAIPAA